MSGCKTGQGKEVKACVSKMIDLLSVVKMADHTKVKRS